MASKREPEIFVFEEKKQSTIVKRKAKPINTAKVDNNKWKELSAQKMKLESEGLDMKKTMREIKAFNSNSLEGTDKKQSQDEYIKILGGTLPKRQKVPYPFILNHRKKEKEKKIKEMELLGHISNEQLRGIREIGKRKGRLIKKKGEERTLHDISVGKFKGGVLKLTAKDIKSFKSIKKK